MNNAAENTKAEGIEDNEDIEETEKKPKAKNKNALFGIIAALVMIGLGIWYWSYVQESKYFTTENAKVATQMFTVTPTTPGRLVKLTVDEGSRVTENEVIGRVENGAYIRSPINGEVIKSDAALNQMVTAATAIAVIADTSNIYVGANIEETDITKIKEGAQVNVTLDAYPGKTFKGHVEEIQQITQTALTGSAMSYSTSGTYTKVTQLIPVKIKIDDDVSLNSLIGTNAKVKIRIK